MIPLLNNQGLPLYVLRRISDKFIINQRAISNTTSLPNPGPDQEYLPIMADTAPDHDPIFTIRTQTESPNENTVPKQWEINYVVRDRTIDEKIAAIDNAKRLEVQKHFPIQDSQENIVILLAAMRREAKGLDLTPDEKLASDKIVAIAARLTENKANAEDMKTAAVAGAKPDLTSGWAPVS